MKKMLAAMLFGIMASTSALAAEPAMEMQKPMKEKKLTKQQMKMKTCSKEAKEKKLKGEERRKFMKSCLSGKNK
jgi:hypothetical protein